MKLSRTIITAATLALAGGVAFASGATEPEPVRVRAGSVVRFGEVGRQPGHVELPGTIGPEGKLYAVIAKGGTLAVGECSSGRLLFRAGRLARGNAAAFSPDGKRIVACLIDGSVRVFDARSGAVTCVLRTKDYTYTSATFSPEGKYLAAVVADRGILVHDAATGVVRLRVPPQKHGSTAALFSPDGSRLATVGRDGSLYVFEISSGRQLLHTTGFRRGAFSPDGRFLLALGEKQSAYLFELPSGRVLIKLVTEEKSVTSAEFSADSKTLATVSRDGVMRLWDTASGRVRSSVKVSTSGNLVVDATPRSGEAAVWQTSDTVLVGDLVITP